MKQTIAATTALALALLGSNASAATFELPVVGTLTYDGYEYCNVTDGIYGCSIVQPFKGTLELTVPSTSTGDYFNPGLTVSLGDSGSSSLIFTSIEDHQIEALIHNGWLVELYAGFNEGAGWMTLNYSDRSGGNFFYQVGSHSVEILDLSIPVPEPATAGMFLSAGALLLLAKRKR